MELSIEMDQSARGGNGYAVVHRTGCRDLRDGMPIGSATSADEVNALVEDATGWEAGDHAGLSPCVKF